MTRMVIDISYAFNLESETIDLEILSPSVAHIARSAQQHIIKADSFNSEQWFRDFEELKKMLKFINRRWPVAGRDSAALIVREAYYRQGKNYIFWIRLCIQLIDSC